MFFLYIQEVVATEGVTSADPGINFRRDVDKRCSERP